MINNIKMLFKANRTFLCEMLKKGKLCILVQIVVTFIGVPINLVQLYMPKYFIDAVTNGVLPQKAIIWIIILVLSQLIFHIISSCANILREKSCSKAKLAVKEETLNHFLSLYLSYFDDTERINKIHRSLSYGETGGTSFFMFLISLSSTLASFLTLTYVSFSFDWWIWLLLFLVFSIKIVIGNKIKAKVHKFQKEKVIRDRKMAYYSGVLCNQVNIPEIRIYNSANFFLNKYRNVYLCNQNEQAKHNIKIMLLTLVEQLPEKAFDIFSYAIIGWRLYHQNATIGDYTLFFSMLTQITSLLNNFRGIFNSVVEHALAAGNYLEFMEDKSELLELGSGKLKIEEIKKITFNNVGFKYKNQNSMAIKNFDLEIKKGEKIGIVGLNGAGKTTLLKLFLLLYKTSEGHIYINDIDIFEIDVYSLYKRIGAVFQNFNTYSLSLSENIALSDDINEEKIIASLKKVGLYYKLSNYKDFPNIPITHNFDKNGIDLSGGERQKIAISRILYKDFDLVILDEPSSSLDAKAQKELCDLIYNISKNKTVIFISHRLKDMISADKIIVMDQGRIISQGTHNELLNFCKEYKEMFELQAN